MPLKNPTAERQPPAHPSCRCTTGLVFDEGAAQADLDATNKERLAAADANPRPGIDDNPDIRRAAKTKFDGAMRKEADINRVLRPIAGDTNAKFDLFSERVKFEASLREKIHREIREAAAKGQTISVKDAVNNIRDENRYTMMWEPDGNYKKSRAAVEKALNDDGWKTIKNANFWEDQDIYDGMNYNFQKGDDIFELQFHTPGSAKLKLPSHELYDQTKLLPDGPKKDAITEEVRKVEKMWNVDRSHVPPGMQDVGTPSRFTDRP